MNPYEQAPSDWKFLSLGRMYDWSKRMPDWFMEDNPEYEFRNKIYKEIDDGVSEIEHAKLTKYYKCKKTSK